MADPIRAVDVPALPGLDDVARPGGLEPLLVQAARVQLNALRDAGRLDQGHAILVALIGDLCLTIARAAVRGQAAGVGMASRQLMDALDKLPPLHDQDGGDDWAAVVAALAPPAADPAA